MTIKHYDSIIENFIAKKLAASRYSESLSEIFPQALKLTYEEWTKEVESEHDYEPIKSYISKGEYGNCIFIVFAVKEDWAHCYEDNKILFQWTYTLKGFLCTEYYALID